MEEHSTASRPDIRWDCAAGVVILATTALAWWFVTSGQLNLVQDEAQYWDWSRTLQLSYYSKGPLIAYIIKMGTLLFGNTEAGVRVGAVAGSALFQGVTYLGVSRLFGRPRLGFWALVIANTMPLFLASSILMTTDNPLLVCWMGALFSLYAASRGWGGSGERADGWRSKAPYVVLGVCVAFGVLAKYMMLAFIPTALIFGLACRRQEGGLPEGFWRRLLIALGAGSAAGLLPILIWNVMHGFAGLHHVTTLGGIEGANSRTILRFDRFLPYIGSQAGLLSPWWFAALLIGATLPLRRGMQEGELDLDRRQWLLLALAFWPVWGFFVVWSFHTKVLPNWSAVSYASGLVLAAAAWDRAWRLGTGYLGRWKRAWLVLGILIAIVVHTLAWLPLPGGLNPTMRLKGWSSLGTELDRLRRTEFQDPDRVFFFSDNYDVTAALSFYVPGQPRAYCVDTGRRLNQYDFWPGPQDKAGWDAVYVVKNRAGEADSIVRGLFSDVRRLEFTSEHQGHPARVFTVYLCRGFSGEWPATSRSGY